MGGAGDHLPPHRRTDYCGRIPFRAHHFRVHLCPLLAASGAMQKTWLSRRQSRIRLIGLDSCFLREFAPGWVKAHIQRVSKLSARCVLKQRDRFAFHRSAETRRAPVIVSAKTASVQGEAYGPAFTVMVEGILQAIAAAGDMAPLAVIIDRNHAAARRPTHHDTPRSGVIVDSARVLSRNQSARNIGQSSAYMWFHKAIPQSIAETTEYHDKVRHGANPALRGAHWGQASATE